MKNDCWDILGIEPTSDKSKIKKAYALLSMKYHPEEHPEKFQHLESAKFNSPPLPF